MSINKKEIRCVFLLLLLLQFFGILYFSTHWWLQWVLTFIMMVPAVRHYHELDRFERCIFAFCVLVLVSCIFSWSYNGQSLIWVVSWSYQFMGLGAYFAIKSMKISIKGIEKVMKILMLLMISCYLLQWLIYPTVIWDSALNDISDSGIFRMRFVGSLFAYVAIFYGLNLYFLYNKKKYLIYTLLGAIPVIIMGFRSLLLLTLIGCLGVLFFANKKFLQYVRYFLLLMTASIIAIQIPLVQEKIDEMADRQESDQTFDNEDYVRWLSLAYYDNMSQEKPVYRVFGGGFPLVSNGMQMQSNNAYQAKVSYASSINLYWNDLGLIGLSYCIGVPAVLLLVYLCMYTMWKSKERNLQFVRFAIFVALFGSIITSMEIYRKGNLLVLAILFYYVSQYKKQKKLV